MRVRPHPSAGPAVRLRLTARHARALLAVVGALLALGAAACGGGGGGGGQPKVGACIDSQKNVVDCGSSSAKLKLVSDQNAPDAIACVQIGSNPQVSVKVGNGTFCAESVSH